MNRDKVVFCCMVALAGCSLPLVTNEEMMDSMWYTNPLNMPKDKVTVTVIWKENVAEACPVGAHACMRHSSDGCFIYTQKPKSWNDNVMLKRLGHELAHCFGGVHE